MEGFQMSNVVAIFILMTTLTALSSQTSMLSNLPDANKIEPSDSILLNNEQCSSPSCETNDVDLESKSKRWTDVEDPFLGDSKDAEELKEKNQETSATSPVINIDVNEKEHKSHVETNQDVQKHPWQVSDSAEPSNDHPGKTLSNNPDDKSSELLNTEASEISENSEEENEKAGKAQVPKLQLVTGGSSRTASEEGESISEENDVHVDRRQKYFSLLYTFGTLFNSFLSEFGEVSENHDESDNSSVVKNQNVSIEQHTNGFNATANGTETGKKTRFQCAVRNATENVTGQVMIVNSTELLEILNYSKHQKTSPCVLVMFYAPWCHFCARTAPQYNALARAFPQLDILAVDTSHFSYLNARFGTVAVPNVMLFHSRSAVRFNHTTRDLEHFVQFICNNTGIEPTANVSVDTGDYIGPLSSTAVQGTDWLLWLSWAFVFICSIYVFVGSQYGQSFITRLRVLWQEHQHIE